MTLNTLLLEEKLRKSISTLEGFCLYVAVTIVETASEYTMPSSVDTVCNI